MADNNKQLKNLVSQFRVRLSEMRAETNKLYDKWQADLDRLETRMLKEEEAIPKTMPEDVPTAEELAEEG